MNPPQIHLVITAKLLALSILSFSQSARPGPVLDSGFQATVSGGTIHVITPQNEKVLIAGDFTHVNGEARPGLARLNPDGSVDSSYGLVPADGTISVILPDPVGNIYIAGSFDHIGQTPRSSLARLLPEGGLDLNFDAGAGPNGRIRSLALLEAGQVLCGGTFNRFAGEPAVHLALTDDAGQHDLAFKPSFLHSSAIEAGIETIALQPDGKILVGGTFETSRGFEHLVRLNADGTLDESFAGLHGPILYPKAILPLANGQVLIAGIANSDGSGLIRRLNSDRTVDETFQPPLFKGSIDCFAIEANGGIILSGSFTEVNGQFRRGLVRLSSEGRLDLNWSVAANGPVTDITLDPEGNLLIAGAFTTIDGASRRGVARILSQTGFGFKAASANSEQFSAKLQARAGVYYVIESSQDLRTWSSVATNYSASTELAISDNSVTVHSRRFFRARLQE
jgi:uncharacterized delta-60 repeat protein